MGLKQSEWMGVWEVMGVREYVLVQATGRVLALTLREIGVSGGKF